MGDDSAGALLPERDDDGSSGPEELQQWEDADSSDGDTFFLDPEGRVPFAGEVSFDFRSAPHALTSALSQPEVLARVVRDCQTVFSARAKKLEYSTGETFWTQADAVPSNSLERLALDIFEAHTRGARFNRATSGAEWWTQVIEDSDDIGWHWDKDYGMEVQGINVHPCLATVTYLSTNGGPTVILEKKGPMACEDVRGVSGEAAKAWISRPSLGKHICFDGRYLHAAPADLALPPLVVTPMSDSSGSTGEQDSRSGDFGGGTKKRDKDGEPKVGAQAAAAPAAKAVPVAVVSHEEKTPAAAAAAAAATEQDNGSRRGPENNGGRAAAGSSSSSRSCSGDGSSRSTPKRRVTFLVNVWLNHAPTTAAALPEATAAELGPSRLAARLTTDDFVPPIVIRVRGEAGDTAAAAAGPVATVGAAPTISGGDGSQEEGRGSGADPRGECATAAAIDMRWEFGEVGDEADRHLRHEVLLPVPAGLLPPPAASAVSGFPSEGRSMKDGAAATASAVAASAAAVGVGGESGSRGGGGGGGGGGSFCVEYPSTSRRPRVSRMGAGSEEEESEDESSSGEEDEDEEEEEEGGKGEESETYDMSPL